MTFRRLWIVLLALGVLPLLLTGLAPAFAWLTVGWVGLLILLALTDWFLFPPLDALGVERLVDERLSFGAPNPVRLRVRNGTAVVLRLEMRDAPPEGMENDQPEPGFAFTVPALGRHLAVYHITPRARGRFAFGDVYLRVQGRLGLVSRLLRLPLP
ncbi:MAG TPA: hypothetical protein VKT32_09545, partial [Chthonomonadaceae bacterium]|nr:hypothetical protein [Chthonomonadaceae bacterium]